MGLQPASTACLNIATNLRLLLERFGYSLIVPPGHSVISALTTLSSKE